MVTVPFFVRKGMLEIGKGKVHVSITEELKISRPPDKSVYQKIIVFISHPKHMLWVLKRTVSMRRFF